MYKHSQKWKTISKYNFDVILTRDYHIPPIRIPSAAPAFTQLPDQPLRPSGDVQQQLTGATFLSPSLRPVTAHTLSVLARGTHGALAHGLCTIRSQVSRQASACTSGAESGVVP